MELIDTDKFSQSLREKAIRVAEKEILITNFKNSQQEKDLTEPPNCDGFGRIRHFRFGDGKTWPLNPLPIYPALKALNMPFAPMVKAQVFQNAVCNWRCWYCFVDFQLLSGNRKFSEYLKADDLVDLYLKETDRPAIIDLTGGQPDLTPEWIVWMMEALQSKGYADQTYLWSDDNLSNDYLWRFLNSKQIETLANYKMYGRVCCFKGIDELSFQQNTGAHPSLYNRQFEIWERLLKLGIDLYSYVTLPAIPTTNFETAIAEFLDRIQTVDEMYPLRMVPLEIKVFSPSVNRIKDLHEQLFQGQKIAIKFWQSQMRKRFSEEILAQNISTFETRYQLR